MLPCSQSIFVWWPTAHRRRRGWLRSNGFLIIDNKLPFVVQCQPQKTSMGKRSLADSFLNKKQPAIRLHGAGSFFYSISFSERSAVFCFGGSSTSFENAINFFIESSAFSAESAQLIKSSAAIRCAFLKLL